MKNSLIIVLVVMMFSACTATRNKTTEILVLGDMHYDRIENHDLAWLAEQGDDLRQVTTEYTVFTGNFWSDFTSLLREKTKREGIDAVLQLGDLSEGLAGTPALAEQMAECLFRAVDSIGFEVPVIIAKGNHDITGPGAEDAFNDIYLPNMARLADLPSLEGADYAKEMDDVLFVCFDPWNRKGTNLEILEKNLTASDAKYKFVLTHEPVIPINERCWHLLRRKPEKRNELLRIIAENDAIVLCAHMHLYSVVRRDTEWGPVVQILVNSVIRDREMTEPESIITEYSESLALNVPDWQPETMEERCRWLREETPHVKYFKQMDLPGYGVLKVDHTEDSMTLEYYAGFGETPFDVVSISEILSIK